MANNIINKSDIMSNDTYFREDICFMCGKTLDEYDLNGGYSLDHMMEYGSKYDTERARACFCTDCYDKILDRLRQVCVISPMSDDHNIYYD